MKKPENAVVLAVGEAKRLRWEYVEMSDIVECLALAAMLDLGRSNPDSEELIKRCEEKLPRIRSQLDGFQRLLESALHLEHASWVDCLQEMIRTGKET